MAHPLELNWVHLGKPRHYERCRAPVIWRYLVRSRGVAGMSFTFHYGVPRIFLGCAFFDWMSPKEYQSILRYLFRGLLRNKLSSGIYSPGRCWRGKRLSTTWSFFYFQKTLWDSFRHIFSGTSMLYGYQRVMRNTQYWVRLPLEHESPCSTNPCFPLGPTCSRAWFMSGVVFEFTMRAWSSETCILAIFWTMDRTLPRIWIVGSLRPILKVTLSPVKIAKAGLEFWSQWNVWQFCHPDATLDTEEPRVTFECASSVGRFSCVWMNRYQRSIPSYDEVMVRRGYNDPLKEHRACAA